MSFLSFLSKLWSNQKLCSWQSLHPSWLYNVSFRAFISCIRTQIFICKDSISSQCLWVHEVEKNEHPDFTLSNISWGILSTSTFILLENASASYVKLNLNTCISTTYLWKKEGAYVALVLEALVSWNMARKRARSSKCFIANTTGKLFGISKLFGKNEGLIWI